MTTYRPGMIRRKIVAAVRGPDASEAPSNITIQLKVRDGHERFSIIYSTIGRASIPMATRGHSGL
jgi:hypothetical protein